MLKALGKKVSNMNVVEGIIGNFSFFSIFDKVEVAQDAELMRNG